MKRNFKLIIVCGVVLVIFIAGVVNNFRKSAVVDIEAEEKIDADYEEHIASGLRMLDGTAEDSDFDVETLITAFKPKAEEGDAGAQNIVGNAYYKIGDMNNAAIWLERAAEQGNSNAYFAISQLYLSGDGVDQNTDKSIEYLVKAGVAGDVDAQSILATIYNFGAYGVTIDYKKAKRWAELAAEQGDAKAQYILGFMYFDGSGVEINYGKAQKWLALAAKQLDDSVLWSEVGALYLNLHNHFEGVEQNYKEGFYWVKKSADSGHADSQALLGLLYFIGKYVEQDYKEAYRLFKQAFENGNTNAAIYIGWIYESDQYSEQDYKKALKWFKLSAEQGDIMAFSQIGLMYESGNGVEKNLNTALEYYKKGAELGDESSEERLSKLLSKIERLDN